MRSNGSSVGGNTVRAASPMPSETSWMRKKVDRSSFVFIDAATIKERLKAHMSKKGYDVFDFYHTKGLWQRIAKSSIFEQCTLVVIFLNTLWIWIDTDYNPSDDPLLAPPEFLLVEHVFCVYFTLEWAVRFKAWKRKRDSLLDRWFVFDSVLVFFMVVETWVMYAIGVLMGGAAGEGMGNVSIMRMARLLRLTRMARMARFLRAFPELMTLIRGIVASFRSVLLTLSLLLIVLYAFGITFTQLAEGSDIPDGSVGASMLTLLVDGVLMDDVGTALRILIDHSWFTGFLFFVFVLLASLTMMNMLIAVVCELVSNVATVETEERSISLVKEKLQTLMKDFEADQDQDNMISKQEFVLLLSRREAFEALEEVGIDVVGLVDVVDFIFEGEMGEDTSEVCEKSLSFEDFMDVLLEFRGTNTATVKNLVDLRRFVQKRLSRIEARCANDGTAARTSENTVVALATAADVRQL
eukprot:CAMPEP_0117558294 /NCGR_PEP_ID=MMETSP0784-20121206/52759_1 /TAXON_ID=39447 /ORGANISM="" /LENGTH=467 /DNA_ID=CAMNT_0005355613 /DNA_START=78 /DNA_END=1478 /DNA_ORIENTATION=-